MNNEKAFTAKKLNRLLFLSMSVMIAITLAVSTYFVIVLDRKSRETAKSNYILSSNNKKVESLAQLKNQYRQMSSLEEKVNRYLPDNKDVSRLLKDMERMAKSNNLDISLYQAGGDKNQRNVANGTEDIQVEKIGDYYVLPIQINITGDFRGVSKLMKDVEAYDRLTEIKSIKYEKIMDQEVMKTGQIQAVLKINAYFKQ